jgi:hypothetical protein
MTDKEFEDKVREMRTNQKAYFKDRLNKQLLAKCKALEFAVDLELKARDIERRKIVARPGNMVQTAFDLGGEKIGETSDESC